jgi:MSHA pilin protein MshD
MWSKPSSKPSVRRQRGVTMVELIIFMVVIGAALAGILGVMSLTTKNSADPVRRKQALILAEGLLEEVELAKFSFCDPTDPQAEEAQNAGACNIPENWGQESSGTVYGRPFDNINDYVAAPNTAVAAFDVGGVLADANGNALNLNGYSARLTIRPAVLGGIGAAGTAANTDVLHITVRVDYDGQFVELDGYRTRFAPNTL